MPWEGFLCADDGNIFELKKLMLSKEPLMHRDSSRCRDTKFPKMLSQRVVGGAASEKKDIVFN